MGRSCGLPCSNCTIQFTTQFSEKINILLLIFYLKCMLSYLIPKYAKYFLVQNSKLPLRFDLLPRYSGQRNCGIENLISTVVKFRWYAKVFFCSVPYPAENKNLATITDFSSIISKKCKTRRLFQVLEQSIRSVFYWAFVRWRMFPSKKKGTGKDWSIFPKLLFSLFSSKQK